jgi:hypothetical protein
MKSRIFGLIDPEDELKIIYQNVGKYPISDTVSHSRRLEFSFVSFLPKKKI